MTASTSQIRLLVMVLIAWCALSAAPVVATSPALPAAFFVIGLGLVAAVTLRFSTLAGFAMALVGAVLFGLSIVSDQPALAGHGLLEGITTGIARPQLVLPVLMAAISLLGAAVCGWLASWGIEGRPGVIQAGAGEEAAGLSREPAAAVAPAAGERAPEEAQGGREEAQAGAEPAAATVAREPAGDEARGVEGPGGVREAAAVQEVREPREATGVQEATGVAETAPAEEAAPKQPAPMQAAPEEAPVFVEESAGIEREDREGPTEGAALEATGGAARTRRRPDSVRRPPRRRKR